MSGQPQRGGAPDIAAWVKSLTRRLVDKPEEVVVESV